MGTRRQPATRRHLLDATGTHTGEALLDAWTHYCLHVEERDVTFEPVDPTRISEQLGTDWNPHMLSVQAHSKFLTAGVVLAEYAPSYT